MGSNISEEQGRNFQQCKNNLETKPELENKIYLRNYFTREKQAPIVKKQMKNRKELQKKMIEKIKLKVGNSCFFK